jgi:hypothetical protein
MVTKHFSRVSTAVLGLAFLASLGCTRSVTAPSNLQISIPQSMSIARSNNAKSKVAIPAAAVTAQLQHVSVSATTSGVATPAFTSWDANGHNGVAVTPPTSYTLSVTGGTVLVQVMALYQDSSTGSTSFWYGDSSVTINSDTSVVITINQVGDSNFGQGTISGQYLTAKGIGPTGSLRLMYPPPDGSAAMLVDTTSIFNGYFSAFAPSDADASFPGFMYLLDDGTNILGTPGAALNLATYTVPTTEKDPAASGQALFAIPAMQNQNAGFSLLGYFGPYSSAPTVSEPICYPSGTATVTNNGNTYTYNGSATSASGSTIYLADHNSEALMTEATNSNGTCADGVAGDVQLVNYLSVIPQQIINQGSTLGYAGPYVINMSNGGGNVATITPGSGTMAFSFSYLPGAISSTGIAGTDVFYRIPVATDTNSSTDFEGIDQNPNCAGLTSIPSYPFTLLGSDASTLTSNPTTVESSTVTATGTTATTLASATSPQVILCPYRLAADGTHNYFVFAAQISGSGGNNNGGCNSNCGQPQATAFNVLDALNNQLTATTPINILTAACSPIYIYGLNGSTPANLYNNSISLSFANIGGASLSLPGVWNGDSSCSVAGDPIQYVSNGVNSGYVIYVKPVATGSFTLSVSGSGLNTFSATVNVVAAPSPLGYSVIPVLPSTLSQYLCYPVNIVQAQFADPSTPPVFIPGPNPDGTTLQVSGSALPTNLGLYSDSACTASISYSSATWVPSASQVASGPMYYMSYGGPVLTSATSINFSAYGTAEQTFGTYTGTVTPPNAVASVNFQGNNAPTIGANTPACDSITLSLVDSNGNPTGTATAISGTVTLSGGNGSFYNNNACGSSISSTATVSFAAGSAVSSTTLYYAASSVGTDTINFSGGGVTGSMMLNTQPQYAMVVTFSPQVPLTGPIGGDFIPVCEGSNNSFITSGTCGISLSPSSGQSFTFTVYANNSIASPAWNIANNFAGSYSVSLEDMTTFSYPLNPLTLSFVGGQSSVGGLNLTSDASHTLQFAFMNGTWTPPPSNGVMPPQFNATNTFDITVLVGSAP